MPRQSQVVLEPRKSPVQARSAASVDAILEATIQVLLSSGKEHLTTTRVAARAGVSIGTLYQYFPNKSALLQGALRRHLESLMDAVEQVCREQRGKPLLEMANALVEAYLQAKMQDAKTSVALYAVSSDVDGATISRQVGERANLAIAELLATAPEQPKKDLQLMASVLQGALAGVSRRLLESHAPERELGAVRQELITLACAYVQASSAVRTSI